MMNKKSYKKRSVIRENIKHKRTRTKYGTTYSAVVHYSWSVLCIMWCKTWNIVKLYVKLYVVKLPLRDDIVKHIDVSRDGDFHNTVKFRVHTGHVELWKNPVIKWHKYYRKIVNDEAKPRIEDG